MTDSRPAIAIQQAETGFNQAQGFEVVEWSPGRALTRLSARPDQLNSQGILHGGVYCAFMDFSCGLVALHPDDPLRAPSCMTLSLSTNFLAPAHSGTVYCTARRTGGGHSIFYAEARMQDADGRPLATAIGSFKYNRKSAPSAHDTTDRKDLP